MQRRHQGKLQELPVAWPCSCLQLLYHLLLIDKLQVLHNCTSVDALNALTESYVGRWKLQLQTALFVKLLKTQLNSTVSSCTSFCAVHPAAAHFIARPGTGCSPSGCAALTVFINMWDSKIAHWHKPRLLILSL